MMTPAETVEFDTAVRTINRLARGQRVVVVLDDEWRPSHYRGPLRSIEVDPQTQDQPSD